MPWRIIPPIYYNFRNIRIRRTHSNVFAHRNLSETYLLTPGIKSLVVNMSILSLPFRMRHANKSELLIPFDWWLIMNFSVLIGETENFTLKFFRFLDRHLLIYLVHCNNFTGRQFFFWSIPNLERLLIIILPFLIELPESNHIFTIESILSQIFLFFTFSILLDL